MNDLKTHYKVTIEIECEYCEYTTEDYQDIENHLESFHNVDLEPDVEMKADD